MSQTHDYTCAIARHRGLLVIMAARYQCELAEVDGAFGLAFMKCSAPGKYDKSKASFATFLLRTTEVYLRRELSRNRVLREAVSLDALAEAGWEIADADRQDWAAEIDEAREAEAEARVNGLAGTLRRAAQVIMAGGNAKDVARSLRVGERQAHSIMEQATAALLAGVAQMGLDLGGGKGGLV